MTISTYVGVPGFAVDVETPEELYEALDSLHTQVMENIPDGEGQQELLAILESAMADIDATFPDTDFW